MCRYHLGLDGSGSSGKRMRPLLGLLSYASIAGDYRRALPGAAAVELGHNFSLVHDDIEDGDTGAARIARHCGPCTEFHRRSTPATCSSL